MIIGIGNDVVDLRRLRRVWARHPQRLPARILCADERAAMNDSILYLGGRWAAKEALGKALACGLRAPLTWRAIAVINDENGQPHFRLSAVALQFLREKRVHVCHLSITHDGDYALATVVAEGK